MLIVTTPSGNIGSEVVKLLRAHSPALPFRLAARNPAKIHQLYGSDIDCTSFDFSDPSTWPITLAGVSTLFLVCPQPDPKTIRTQIIPFIDAAIHEGCQHLIYLSVPGADRSKILPHYQIERHIEASHVPYTILRPAYFMQNFTRSVPTHDVDISLHHEIFIPAGNGHITMIDARDVAEVIVHICEDPSAHIHQAYTLTELKHRDLSEVAAIFSSVLELPVYYNHPSLFRFWSRLRKRGVSTTILFVMSVEYTLARFGMSVKPTATFEQIMQRPPTTLAQFVANNRQHWFNDA